MKSAWAFICICLIVVSASGIFAQNEGTDFRIIKNISEHRTSAGKNFYKFVSGSSFYIDIAAPTSMFAAALAVDNKDLKKKAIIVAESQVANLALTYLSKYIINRERPADAHPGFIQLEHPTSPSFPSGHTSGAFATATSLSLAFPKWYVIAPSYSWAALVGYSRMYLGVHYPSDVLAGAILGSSTAWLSYKVNKRWQQKKTKSKTSPVY